ncbi:MAG: hypothetical protein ACWGQW_02910 [bacterium]
MIDWLKKTEVIVGVLLSLVGLVSAGWALEVHWNQQEEVEDCMFCAMTNKEFFLETKLKEICAKYNRPYPCTTNGMTDYDTALYEQYKEWLRDLQKQIGKKITG